MSLFPAYAGGSEQLKTETSEDNDWLKNNSFPTSYSANNEEKESHEYQLDNKLLEIESKIRYKEKKRKKKKISSSVSKNLELERNVLNDNDDFFFDKERQLVYLSETTLPKSLRPKYCALYPGLFPNYTLFKKNKNKRYFKISKHSEDNKGSEKEVLKETLASKRVEYFNKKLTENPHDIQCWIEYVNYQDEFYDNQHMKYKTSVEKDRAIALHKLSILDKAVAQNSGSRDLQSLWLEVGTKVLPSEEMSKRIDKILEDFGGTMTLWLGLMTTTQYSLARCTVPSVSKLYEKLLVNFQTLKKSHRNSKDFHIRDENVLELLFHYGKFLDNCGHWETLWMIIKVNLQFNTSIQLDITIDVDNKVKKLEDEALKNEKQGVWHMWSHLERIREGLHFLPETNSNDYPQRYVAPENVINFTWHFYPELHFQLIVSVILLIKVPLLPSTHTQLQLLSPNSLPWIFDSPEFILSSLLNSPALCIRYNHLKPLTQLSRGPQYLRRLHGQEEFFDLIGYTFEACLKCLEGRQKTALGLWWLRFERWIYLLDKNNLASLPEKRKSAKAFFKDFMAHEENRENLLYYIDYSLLQFNQNNVEACVKTLKTILTSSPLSVEKEERATLTAAYRVLCEVLVGTNQSKEAINILINLGNGVAFGSPVTIHSLVSAKKRFEKICFEQIEELSNSQEDCSLENLLLPIFCVDWISCYFWLIALTKPTELRNITSNIFNLIETKTGFLVEYIKECLWENVLTILWTCEKNNFLYINDVIQKCHLNFPKNLRILNLIADINLQKPRLWLAIRKVFLSSSSMIGCIFLICVALEKFYANKESLENRMKNLFQELALTKGKLSSIIHSLRLRFLFEFDKAQLDVAQLQALESCPWNKSIYMESILLLPEKLMQLTDVLVEKEMKIHITPDEIQEMRD